METPFSFLLPFFYVVVAVGVILLIGVIAYYNRFVALRNKAREAWSGIDIQLKHRYDLIPNALETVKQYAAHEKQVMEQIANSRALGIQADTVQRQTEAENQINNALDRLFAIVESYPELKASENFREFQETLEEIEEQIQLARRYYNAVVRDNNTALESFPGVIFANSFNFKTFEFFEMEEPEHRKNVKVKF